MLQKQKEILVPDWSLFWEQAWIGICAITYVVLVIAVVGAFFAAIVFGVMTAWHFAVEWWEDREADIAAQEQRRKWAEYDAFMKEERKKIYGNEN